MTAAQAQQSAARSAAFFAPEERRSGERDKQLTAMRTQRAVLAEFSTRRLAELDQQIEAMEANK